MKEFNCQRDRVFDVQQKRSRSNWIMQVPLKARRHGVRFAVVVALPTVHHERRCCLGCPAGHPATPRPTSLECMAGYVFDLLSFTRCMSTLRYAGGAPPTPPPAPPASRGGDGARARAAPARPRKNNTQPFTSLHDAPLWAADFFDNLRLRPGRRRPAAGGGGVGATRWVPPRSVGWAVY